VLSTDKGPRWVIKSCTPSFTVWSYVSGSGQDRATQDWRLNVVVLLSNVRVLVWPYPAWQFPQWFGKYFYCARQDQTLYSWPCYSESQLWRSRLLYWNWVIHSFWKDRCTFLKQEPPPSSLPGKLLSFSFLRNPLIKFVILLIEKECIMGPELGTSTSSGHAQVCFLGVCVILFAHLSSRRPGCLAGLFCFQMGINSLITGQFAVTKSVLQISQ
jgi:hypothetical protein